MSRYIGKRVSYECGFCKKQFTLNRQSVDDSEKSDEVFCSTQCSEQFYLSDVSSRADIKFLCDTLGDIFDRFQISSSYFYGEDKDNKILTKISAIRKKHGC